MYAMYMAMSILSRAGHSADLSTYEYVDLVTYTNPDGTETIAVAINENEVVFVP